MHLFCGKRRYDNATNLKRIGVHLALVILIRLISFLYFTVDGGWSSWSDWKSCTKSCGTGFQEHFRSCTRPAPSYGGKPCGGEARESRWCNTHSCPGKYRVGESLTGIFLFFVRINISPGSSFSASLRLLIISVEVCKLCAVAVRVQRSCNQFVSVCS